MNRRMKNMSAEKVYSFCLFMIRPGDSGFHPKPTQLFAKVSVISTCQLHVIVAAFLSKSPAFV
jgi:hypothetical protein